MTIQRDPMLDEEERKLAAQLARIAPHGEPSADLDARILAMAERGLAGVMPTGTQRKRPHRWPVWLGAAASLTVVAGLVWQLQDVVLHPRETISYEAPASVTADTDPNGQRQPIDYVGSSGPSADAVDAAMPPPPPPSEPAAATQAVAQVRPAPSDPEAEVMAAPEPVAAPVPPPQPAPAQNAMANAAGQADAAAAKAMAADRTMAQEAPRRVAPTQADAASMAGSGAPARVRQPMMSPPPPQAVAETNEDLVIESVAPAPTADRAGFDARPPATADTPEVQRAWLSRIRELRNAGRIDEARSSLAAFIKRNPKAEVPADLKPLLPTPASPSTQP